MVEACLATSHSHGTTKLSRKSDSPESLTSPARVEQVESLAPSSDDIVDSVASLHVSPSRVGLTSSVLVLGIYVSGVVVVNLGNGLLSHPTSLRDAALRFNPRRAKSVFLCTLRSAGFLSPHGGEKAGMSGTAGI